MFLECTHKNFSLSLSLSLFLRYVHLSSSFLHECPFTPLVELIINFREVGYLPNERLKNLDFGAGFFPVVCTCATLPLRVLEK